eukprot:s1825_g11.t4
MCSWRLSNSESTADSLKASRSSEVQIPQTPALKPVRGYAQRLESAMAVEMQYLYFAIPPRERRPSLDLQNLDMNEVYRRFWDDVEAIHRQAHDPSILTQSTKMHLSCSDLFSKRFRVNSRNGSSRSRQITSCRRTCKKLLHCRKSSRRKEKRPKICRRNCSKPPRRRPKWSSRNRKLLRSRLKLNVASWRQRSSARRSSSLIWRLVKGVPGQCAGLL